MPFLLCLSPRRAQEEEKRCNTTRWSDHWSRNAVCRNFQTILWLVFISLLLTNLPKQDKGCDGVSEMRGEGSETRQATRSLQELKGMLRRGMAQGTSRVKGQGQPQTLFTGPSQSQEGGRTTWWAAQLEQSWVQHGGNAGMRRYCKEPLWEQGTHLQSPK